MRKWYLIDDCISSKAEVFETELKATVKNEAIQEAKEIYNRLSDHDKKLRDEFYIGHFETDEDGNLNYDTMIDYVDIVKEVK